MTSPPVCGHSSAHVPSLMLHLLTDVLVLDNHDAENLAHFEALAAHLPASAKSFANSLIEQWKAAPYSSPEDTQNIRSTLAKLVFLAEHNPDLLSSAEIDLHFLDLKRELFGEVRLRLIELDGFTLHSFAEIYQTQIAQMLSCVLLTSNGLLNLGLIDSISDADWLNKLDLNKLDSSLQPLLDQIKVPQNPATMQMIRNQLQLPQETPVTALHAKQVVLSAFLIGSSDLKTYITALFAYNPDQLPEDELLDHWITISPDGKINGVGYAATPEFAHPLRQMGIPEEDSDTRQKPGRWIIDMTPRAWIAQFTDDPEILAKGFAAFSIHRHFLVEARK